MDKQTYIQLDRMERKMDKVIEGLEISMNMDVIESLGGFYEDEILSENGELHHLVNDEKVRNFFEKMLSDEEEEDSNKNPPPKNNSEEYRQP